MKLTTLVTFSISMSFATAASAQRVPDPDKVPAVHEGPTQLSLFTSAGWLTSSGANGAALSTGVRLAIGEYFALGFDLGYGLLSAQAGASATTGTLMEDRWWFMPSMAGVIPVRLGRTRATFDIGAGLGLGTASGYKGWDEYTSHPFTADWEFQLEPTVRAHAMASLAISRTVDVFLRAEAAALVLPHGVAAGPTDSTWMLVSLGTRFRLL